MYPGYLYPFYRSYSYPVVYPYSSWGSYGYAPYGYGYGSNIVGSAVANQSLINTGTASGITQIATPTVIW